MAFLILLFTSFALTKRFGIKTKRWVRIINTSTLVFSNEDLQRIWKWEIANGHYPSHQSIPEKLRFLVPQDNPALPLQYVEQKPTPGSYVTSTRGTGANRTYLINRSHPPTIAYPPRPVPGSAADMDVILDHCDFSGEKYVRDCLEVLRLSAGLDVSESRKSVPESWKYIYQEAPGDIDPRSKSRGAAELTALLSIMKHRSSSINSHCDPNYPRIFHLFWTGPFTDKPYTALLSFLYTQNTGLYLRVPSYTACRPQIWIWINPGPAASAPNSSALDDMYDDLQANQWSSPFLHTRFRDVIVFKLWNTTEQLDSITELKKEWRGRDLFNSGGNIIPVPQDHNAVGNKKEKFHEDSLLNRAGSKSSSTYDRLSVILSDMARFVLCHRYGGTYLDADTVFLRDWEELWGWKGAYAYRWSRLKRYNTAVLHLNKGSALGTFIFRTALNNDFDFHPMTISRYTKDAHLEGLLLRLPDALFDPAWLNTENYQRDRPPQPYFTDFSDFFETPVVNSAAPKALGFDGFFKGAYSYHFHNFWWKPFDPERNWPDLGPRFERVPGAGFVHPLNSYVTGSREDSDMVEDKLDLGWATILKRTFEAYIRGERPNMYGEWLIW